MSGKVRFRKIQFSLVQALGAVAVHAQGYFSRRNGDAYPVLLQCVGEDVEPYVAFPECLSLFIYLQKLGILFEFKQTTPIASSGAFSV